jgi:NTP pyrophosphatase (non-canonical NTP hydrolase)
MPDAIARMTRLACDFRDERDWKQFHNAKDMAVSLALEAAEVLELTQWKNDAELRKYLAEHTEKLADELSDVLYWVLMLAHDHGIDLARAFEKKIEKNRKKYPVEKAKGVARKYTEL